MLRHEVCEGEGGVWGGARFCHERAHGLQLQAQLAGLRTQRKLQPLLHAPLAVGACESAAACAVAGRRLLLQLAVQQQRGGARGLALQRQRERYVVPAPRYEGHDLAHEGRCGAEAHAEHAARVVAIAGEPQGEGVARRRVCHRGRLRGHRGAPHPHAQRGVARACGQRPHARDEARGLGGGGTTVLSQGGAAGSATSGAQRRSCDFTVLCMTLP